MLLEKFNTKIKIPKTLRWQKQKLHQFIQDETKPMNLLILDEMDQLSSKNEQVGNSHNIESHLTNCAFPIGALRSV